MPPSLPPPLSRHLALRPESVCQDVLIPTSAEYSGPVTTGISINATGAQGAHLDDFPDKPRHGLELHLPDVLLQHFHEDFVV